MTFLCPKQMQLKYRTNIMLEVTFFIIWNLAYKLTTTENSTSLLIAGTGKTVVAGDVEYFNELQAKEPTVNNTDVLYE